jgi:hypothetical protein
VIAKWTPPVGDSASTTGKRLAAFVRECGSRESGDVVAVTQGGRHYRLSRIRATRGRTEPVASGLRSRPGALGSGMFHRHRGVPRRADLPDRIREHRPPPLA